MTRTLFSLMFLLLCTTGAIAEELPATVRWAETSTLSTPLSGRIGAIRVDVGDRVKKNALLAALDARPFQAEIRRAKAELARLEGALKIAERERRHAEELYDRTVLSTTALEDAQVREEEAAAAVARASAELELARLDLEYSQLRAPFAGIITARHIHPGEVVSNRCEITPMLEIARGDALLAVARITPQQADRLRRGDPVGIVVAGRSYEGKVARIAAIEGNPSLLELRVYFAAREVSAGEKATIALP